jgi:predicted nucleotidyltransferase
VDTRSDKIDELKILLNRLQQKQINLKDVFLFGSFVKSEIYNDIDVALISDDFSGIRFYDVEKIADMLKRYPPEFDLHPFNTANFYDSDNFFAQEILETGQRVVFK